MCWVELLTILLQISHEYIYLSSEIVKLSEPFPFSFSPPKMVCWVRVCQNVKKMKGSNKVLTPLYIHTNTHKSCFFKNYYNKINPKACTCVSCKRCCGNDGFVLAEVWALPHIVFERALRLVAVQGGGVVFWVKAVVGRYPLQAAERRLTTPGLGQPLTALEALDALKGVLATKLAWGTGEYVK